MPLEPNQTTAERGRTDESLRIERENADDVLGEGPSELDETADAVISKARARADSVLAAARAKTDRRTGNRPLTAHSPGSVAADRLREDNVIRAERSDADHARTADRAEHAALLAVERAATDRDLLRERERGDEAVATRDEFLGLVSHELRNMLGAVVGLAGLAEAEASRENRPAKIVGYAQRIKRAGGRMTRLVGDLADLASIEAGALAVTLEDADPASLVSEALDTFREQAATSGVSLVTEIVSPLPRAQLDSARILQVLVNLLSNALKFTPRDGTVRVRVECVGAELRFAVHDTGIGIPADKLEAVFERFVQVGKDRRGVGLGLYISRCIMHAHGGRVWAESSPGEGSTFRLALATRVEA
jgi:signal transduction histidine kinase